MARFWVKVIIHLNRLSRIVCFYAGGRYCRAWCRSGGSGRKEEGEKVAQ